MEKFFWADEIANKIISEKGNKKQYVCASGITPSGHIHIGNFREVITTELVIRALKGKGKKVRFVYSWDDYDRFRKVPRDVPKKYEKYIGMPLSEVPSPFKKSESYANYFEKKFEKELKSIFIEPEFIRQSEMNKKSKYADLIKISLENRKKIINILNKYRKEPLDKNWTPITVYCEKCKKDNTRVLGFNDYIINYKCSCGKEHSIDIRKKGIVKATWRVDWPMRWKYESVDFEPGGIDHSTPGGSYTTAKEISKEIFDFDPPIYTFYEWVRIKGGTEFSSSVGNVITLSDVEEIYEPEVLRYLFVGTRPNKGFQISFDNDVIKIYEDYDNLEKKYFSKKANPQERRIYELSKVKVPKKQPVKLGFKNLITYAQINKVKDLREIDKKRAEKVVNWLNKYAPQEVKFEVQEKIKVKLNAKEMGAIVELREFLKKKILSEEELINKFYKIIDRIGIEKEKFFEAAYKTILNKKRGPRLTQLILNIDKEKLIKLLNQIK